MKRRKNHDFFNFLTELCNIQRTCELLAEMMTQMHYAVYKLSFEWIYVGLFLISVSARLAVGPQRSVEKAQNC